MRSLSSVGLGLSVIFGCLLLALVAELYYLLWWKKRFTRPEMQNDYANPAARELLFMLCCKNPSPSSSSSALNPKITDTRVQESQPGNKDLLIQSFGDHDEYHQHDHHDCGALGPGLMPRFLFTIIEETKEDLESEEGLSVRGRSLSDLFLNVESGNTPYLTPLASPSQFTPPFTPSIESCYNRIKNKKEGSDSSFESSADAEFNRIIRSSSSSPPPRFQFLRDAEEKLYRRKVMESEEAERLRANNYKSPALKSSVVKDGGENGSFIRIVVDGRNENEFEFKNNYQSNTTSQVLPLAGRSEFHFTLDVNEQGRRI